MLKVKDVLALTLIAVGTVLFATTGLYAQSLVEICDREAGYLGDNLDPVVGVSWKDLNPEIAVPACEKALEEAPDDARVMDQLGRSFKS